MNYEMRDALLCVAGCTAIFLIVGGIVLCALQPFGAIW